MDFPLVLFCQKDAARLLLKHFSVNFSPRCIVPFVACLVLCRHAHYQTGNTPLALVWKDENCSEYVIDTDSKGQVPNQQQVILDIFIFIRLFII